MIKKSLTLVELILSIALLSLILLGAASFSYGSMEMLKSSQRMADVFNERNLILDYIGRYVHQAVGDVNNPGIQVRAVGGGNVIDIRIDPHNTPADYTDDEWVSFFCSTGTHLFVYYPPRSSLNLINGHVISTRVTNFNFTIPAMNPSARIVTHLTLIDNPLAAIDQHSNPQILLVQPITFTSLAHSIN